MIYVYVKHYLTPEGMVYDKTIWYPKVHKLMSQQFGYVDFYQNTLNESTDCFNLIVKFEDKQTLDRWVAHPKHDSFINILDNFRSRDYWEAALTEDEAIQIDNLD